MDKLVKGKGCMTMSLKELFERLVILEATFNTTVERDKEALILARELIAAETKHAREIFDDRLKHLNENQRRMDRLEDSFARLKDVDDLKLAMKDFVTKEAFDGLKRLVLMGIGIALALSVVVPIFAHVYAR